MDKLPHSQLPVNVKKLGTGDINQFMELILLFKEVFEMEDFKHPPLSYLKELLDKDHFMVFVAESEGKVVGGLTSYILLQYYSQHPLAYIFDLAVKKELQRAGIGKKLMAKIQLYCKDRGVEEVFVQADEGDANALDFYRTTGGRAEKVVHFTYSLISQVP